MVAPPTKRREAPSEPLKRVLGPAVRAIAGDSELDVDFGPGKGDVSGKAVHIPEPPRAPSAKDIALARGWADSLALRIGCHDAKIHRRMAPPPGPARAVFEAAERARVEGLGSTRMPGMASNLTARLEDQYSHGRFRTVSDRTDAPLEDALALLIRERLTGLASAAVDERPCRCLAAADRSSRRQAFEAARRALGKPGAVRAPDPRSPENPRDGRSGRFSGAGPERRRGRRRRHRRRRGRIRGSRTTRAPTVRTKRARSSSRKAISPTRKI